MRCFKTFLSWVGGPWLLSRAVSQQGHSLRPPAPFSSSLCASISWLALCCVALWGVMQESSKSCIPLPRAPFLVLGVENAEIGHKVPSEFLRGVTNFEHKHEHAPRRILEDCKNIRYTEDACSALICIARCLSILFFSETLVKPTDLDVNSCLKGTTVLFYGLRNQV